MSLFNRNQTKKVVVNADNHGYQPSVVIFKQGKPAHLKFIPSENMGCMGTVNSADLHFNADLNSGQAVTVDVPTDKPGTYNYACSMNMFHGKVVVK